MHSSITSHLHGIFRILGVCLLAALCTIAAPVYSQEADDDSEKKDSEATEETQQGGEIEEVIVTGSYAGSLRVAQEMKRDSELVTEALSITDLGRLPDVNIADALQRLPGVAAVRDPNSGAPSSIQLRGMPAELTLGTLNGRDLATQSPTRNVRYDQFPSELIGGVVIYKSTQASIDDGGVAGVIDMRMLRPLDYKENKLSIEAAYMTNELADDLSRADCCGYRGSITYVFKTEDDTLGFALGWAHRDEPVAVMRTQHQAYRPPPNDYKDVDGDGVGDIVTYGLNHFDRAGKDKQDGAFAIVEWEPSESFSLYIDGLYSQVDVNNDINGFDIRNVSELWTNDYTDARTIDHRLVSGTVTAFPDFYGGEYGVRLENTAAFSDRDDNLKSLGANAVWQLNDTSQIIADLAYSKADYLARYASIGTQPLDLTSGDPTVLLGQAATYDATYHLPRMSMNVDLTDPNVNRVYSLTAPFYEDGTDEILTAKLDFDREISWGLLERFSVGVRYVDRNKTNLKLSQSGFIPVADRTPLTGDLILPNAQGSYSGPQTSVPGFLTFDFFAAADAYFGGYNPVSTPADQTGSWEVDETTTAAYVQLDFAGGDRLPYSGNFGLRYVDTESTSSSSRLVGSPDGTIVQPFSVDNDYQEWLPSFSLNLRPGEDWVIRFGIGKTIARAPVDDLNAGFQAYVGFGAPQAFGGNPKLEPFRANQVDLSAEYYYAPNGYIAVATYYKDLDTYITTSTETVDVGGVEVEFFRPVNGEGGHIKGIEFTLSHQFSSLPAPFSGLGIYANAAFVDSDIEVSRNFSDATLGLLGLSDYVYTIAAYYDLGGFDANISYSARDSYPHIVDGGAFETTDSEGFLIAQVSYAFTENWSVFWKGLNLTNQIYETYLGNGNPNIRGRYEEYGRTYYLGVKAEF